MDAASKQLIADAAELCGISVSEFIRRASVSEARRELAAANDGVIRMTPEEQLAFWNALHEPVKLTPSQRGLSAIMRGEA
jgi:uncharacterized protein (DUF1778 family)